MGMMGPGITACAALAGHPTVLIARSEKKGQTGLATPEEVDTAIKMGMGIRFPVWGPLEHIDAVGLDLALSVQRNVLPGLNSQSEPPAYLQQLVREGQLGYKSGQGVYDI